MNTVKRRRSGRPIRLTVGIIDVVPKLLAARLLESAFRQSSGMRLISWEDQLEQLFADLAIHGLDSVIADTPAPSTIKVQAYGHLMGESGITFFASLKLAARDRRNFPHSLNGAPISLPTSNTVFRRLLDDWLANQKLSTTIIGEFEDSATPA